MYNIHYFSSSIEFEPFLLDQSDRLLSLAANNFSPTLLFLISLHLSSFPWIAASFIIILFNSNESQWLAEEKEIAEKLLNNTNSFEFLAECCTEARSVWATRPESTRAAAGKAIITSLPVVLAMFWASGRVDSAVLKQTGRWDFPNDTPRPWFVGGECR